MMYKQLYGRQQLVMYLIGGNTLFKIFNCLFGKENNYENKNQFPPVYPILAPYYYHNNGWKHGCP